MPKALPMVGNCNHHIVKLGKHECMKGVDIRVHVGGPDWGWGTRMPCHKGGYTKPDEVVECKLAEFPTKEEADAALEGLMKSIDANKCPTCGEALVVSKNPDITVCPVSPEHLFIRDCCISETSLNEY